MLARLGRTATVRSFSTTPAANIDLSNLYSKITGWRRKTPAQRAVDPTIKDDSNRSDNSMSQQSLPRVLQIIGKPKDIEENWPEVKEYAEFEAWPTNHYRDDLHASEVEAALKLLTDSQFSSISSRFDTIKSISQQLRIAVPDPAFSEISSVQKLREHLLSHARPFDERQPDAIYLNLDDFVGTNITIEDPVTSRRSQKKRREELVEQARQAQERRTDELIRGTSSTSNSSTSSY